MLGSVRGRPFNPSASGEAEGRRWRKLKGGGPAVRLKTSAGHQRRGGLLLSRGLAWAALRRPPHPGHQPSISRCTIARGLLAPAFAGQTSPIFAGKWVPAARRGPWDHHRACRFAARNPYVPSWAGNRGPTRSPGLRTDYRAGGLLETAKRLSCKTRKRGSDHLGNFNAARLFRARQFSPRLKTSRWRSHKQLKTIKQAVGRRPWGHLRFFSPPHTIGLDLLGRPNPGWCSRCRGFSGPYLKTGNLVATTATKAPARRFRGRAVSKDFLIYGPGARPLDRAAWLHFELSGAGPPRGGAPRKAAPQGARHAGKRGPRRARPGKANRGKVRK